MTDWGEEMRRSATEMRKLGLDDVAKGNELMADYLEGVQAEIEGLTKELHEMGGEIIGWKNSEQLLRESRDKLQAEIERLTKEHEVAEKQWECDWDHEGDYELIRTLLKGEEIAPAVGSVAAAVKRELAELQAKIERVKQLEDAVERLSNRKSDMAKQLNEYAITFSEHEEHIERLNGLLPAAKQALRAVTIEEQEEVIPVLWAAIEKADPDYMMTKDEWLAALKQEGDDV